MILNEKTVVLASASPRRLDILRQLGIEPIVAPSDAEELKELKPGTDPGDFVCANAAAKAQSVAANYPDALILGADTVVVLEGHAFGKPADAEEAKGMLNLISGRVHQVYTGMYLLDTKSGKSISAAECCDVKFARLSDAEIEAYVACGEPMDKAGAYGIQGRGAMLVEEIRGDYYTVVGLSVAGLRRLCGVFARIIGK